MVAEAQRFEHGHVTLDLSDGFVRIVVPRTGDGKADADALRSALASVASALGVTAEEATAIKARLHDSIMGKRAEANGAAITRQPDRPARQGRSGARKNDLRRVDEKCDQCGKQAFEKAGFWNKKTGKRVSARIVCTSCKDGQYDYLIRWVDEDEPSDEPC